MSDETSAPVPPCSCIERRDGHWMQYCDCANTGDLAMAQSWCTEQNMIESQRRDPQSAPVPPGWVRLEVCDGVGGTGTIDVKPDDIVSVYVERGVVEEIVIRDGNPVTPNHTPAEVAAMIAAAQRAQRRFDALPVMAAKLYGIGGMGTQEAVTAALALIDAIEAREAGR